MPRQGVRPNPAPAVSHARHQTSHGQGIRPNDPRTVHLVIVGFGRMGRSLALRAAKMGHFANGKLLRISVIDREADRQREHFLFRYPALESDKICRLAFHPADAQSLMACPPLARSLAMNQIHGFARPIMDRLRALIWTKMECPIC